MSGYVSRRVAALAIRGYRRYVSGRGPLRRVACTFAATESCSAYGLRAVEELATSLPHALRLVRARIRACRCVSVYRFAEGFGWERDHELAPAVLASQLAARGEQPATIAQVLAARTLIARWRGERAAYAEAMQLARSAERIPVRAGDAAISHHRRAMHRGFVLTLLAAVAVVVHVTAVLPCLLGVLATVNARSSLERLERQRVAARFLRPAVPNGTSVRAWDSMFAVSTR